MERQTRSLLAALLLASSALALSGCVFPLVEVRPQVNVSNITINVPENISIQTPNQTRDFNLTIANAPNNLTVCIIGIETQQSDDLFTGSFTHGSRNFSFHPQYYSGEDDLGECNLFVAKGDAVGQYVGRTQRDALVKGVNDGVSLLMDRLALFYIKEDPTVDGWQFIVKDILPIQSQSIAHELVIPQNKTISRTLKFVNNDWIWQGYKNFAVQNLEIFEVIRPESTAVIPTAYFATDSTSASDLAIIYSMPFLWKSSMPFAGKVIYFSYDAFDTTSTPLKGITRQAVIALLQDFLANRFIL